MIHSLMDKDYATAKECLTLAVEARIKDRISGAKKKKDKEEEGEKLQVTKPGSKKKKFLKAKEAKGKK